MPKSTSILVTIKETFVSELLILGRELVMFRHWLVFSVLSVLLLLELAVLIIVLGTIAGLHTYASTYEGVVIYARMASRYWGIRGAVWGFCILLLPLVGATLAVAWGVVSNLVNTCHSVATKESPRFRVRYHRCGVWLSKQGSRPFFILKLVLGLIATVIIMVYALRPETVFPSASTLRLMLAIYVVCVPAVFVVFWKMYLNIRRKRMAIGRSVSVLDEYYLFSKRALRRGFSNTIAVLLFFALLGWWGLPGAVQGFGYISERGANLLLDKLHYADDWDLFHRIEEKEPQDLPAPAEMHELSLLPSGIEDLFGGENHRVFVRGLLLVTTWYLLVYVASSTWVAGRVRYQGHRTLKNSLMAAAKAFLVVTVFQVVLAKAYFVSAGSLINAGTVFLFFTSFFMTYHR